MKKKGLLALIWICLVCVLPASAALPQEWRAHSLLERIDFGAEEEITLQAKSGQWIRHLPDCPAAERVNPQDTRWSGLNGDWRSTEEGIFQDSEEAALQRAIWKEDYRAPIISAEVRSDSEEGCVFIYFAMRSDSAYAAVELGENGSKLTIDGAEFFGGGALLPGEETTLRLEVSEDTVAFYQDETLILYQGGLSVPRGYIGMGGWATKMRIAEWEVAEQSLIGNREKLWQTETGAAYAELSEMQVEQSLIRVRLGADNFADGLIGTAFRVQENGDGYYLASDGETLRAYCRENGENHCIGKAEYRMLSDRLYRLNIAADEEKISVEVDGELLMSVPTETFRNGGFGLFSKGTAMFCESAEVWRLAEVTAPCISEGRTDYYFDSVLGDDRSDGKTPETAWKSLDKLAFAKFSAGDRLLFRRGQSFAGTLHLADSEEIVISAWGEGENPVIVGCRYAAELEQCKDVSITGVDFRITHRGTKKTPALGSGAAVLLSETSGVSLMNCRLTGSGSVKESVPICGTDADFVSLRLSGVDAEEFGDSTMPEGEKLSEEITSHWGYPIMRELISEGIFTEYRPEDSVTRAEFAVLVSKSLALHEGEYHGIFTDVAAEFWGAGALQTLHNYRMLPEEMTENGCIFPNHPLNRAEAAEILAGALPEKREGVPAFCDLEKLSEKTRASIEKAWRAGIFGGKSETEFAPEARLSRAEAAVLVKKLRGGAE